MKNYITTALIPPVGACKFGCGTNCAAPITVFWLFGIISIIFGFLGGPTNEANISWYTVGLGLGMWGIAATWSLLTMKGVEADRCQDLWSTKSNKISALDDDVDPFEEINKAH